MKKKRKANRLFLCLLFIIFVGIIIMSFLNRRHSYNTSYNVYNVAVFEEYSKENSNYTFTLKYKDIDYKTIVNTRYINSKKLINDINIVQNRDLMCLYIIDSKISLYPFCYNVVDKKYYSPFYNDIEFIEKSNYKNIKIDDYDNQKYLLWNYNGFIYFDTKDIKNIDLFNKDIYNINLYYQTKDYLIIPDYDNEYYFKKVYLINIKNGKVSTIDLRFDISFNSYFLGDYKNKVYLYDIKNEIEYYIDLDKRDLYKTNYKTLVNNKFVNVSNQKLKTEKVKFENNSIYKYLVDNDTLYMNDLIVAKGDIKIVNVIDRKVFYTIDDTLYSFDIYNGKKAVFKYSEWKFNNQNMIFVF